MAFILPKGIVVNSPDLNLSIERINAQSLDLEDIAKFWKVYTTTKRRLLDPTAERLENYWWRIWGSRRRELSGATIGRLFAHISDGQSFVPLRGPANRDEGGTAPMNRTARNGAGGASATTIHRPSQSRPSTTPSSTASKNPASMPHPILKKTRGPSSTGPRPTARFISPHESDAETATTTNSSNRSISPNSHVVVQPPSPDSQNSKSEEKKAAAAGGAKKKGRVFASTVTKKRPVITRRQSSLSSTDSAARIEAQQAHHSSAERTWPTFPEEPHGKGKAPSKLQGNVSPEYLATLSPEKRSSSKTADPKRTSSRTVDQKDRSGKRLPDISAQEEPGPSSGLRSAKDQQLSGDDISEEELELQQTLLEAANAVVKKSSGTLSQQALNENEKEGPPTRLATTSDGVHDQNMTGSRLKSAAVLAPTLTDATGQLDFGDSTIPLSQVLSAEGRNKGKGRDPDDMFAKRPVPSASGNVATPTPGGPLTKSKSQLTLLLQKDRARTGEAKPSDGKKKDRQN